MSVTHLLTLSGRLNELELELLELAVQTIVASGGRDVVVDLSMAELPDRALVHALGRARALMIAAGGALSVANRDVVRKAYTIERLGPPQLASLGYLNEVLEADPQRGSRG